MKHRSAKTATAVALTVAMISVGGVALAMKSGPPVQEPTIPAADSGEQPSISTRASGCHRSYTSGTGISAFNWCFSADGNITMLENSAGLEHIDNGTITEGWCLSAGHVKQGVTYGSSANEGLQPALHPAASKVAHKTLDDNIRIEQRFVQSKNNRKINIIMKVKNLSDAPLNNVYLTRFVDADLSNTTSGDVWVSGTRSVAAYEAGSSRLELIPQTIDYSANSMIFDSWLPTLDEDCYDATADTTVEAPAGDRSMGVMYQLGTIFPGENKEATFTYRISI